MALPPHNPCVGRQCGPTPHNPCVGRQCGPTPHNPCVRRQCGPTPPQSLSRETMWPYSPQSLCRETMWPYPPSFFFLVSHSPLALPAMQSTASIKTEQCYPAHQKIISSSEASEQMNHVSILFEFIRHINTTCSTPHLKLLKA